MLFSILSKTTSNGARINCSSRVHKVLFHLFQFGYSEGYCSTCHTTHLLFLNPYKVCGRTRDGESGSKRQRGRGSGDMDLYMKTKPGHDSLKLPSSLEYFEDWYCKKTCKIPYICQNPECQYNNPTVKCPTTIQQVGYFVFVFLTTLYLRVQSIQFFYAGLYTT